MTMTPEERAALERAKAAPFDRVNSVIEELAAAGDRAAVIVAAALLDELLAEALRRFLLPESGDLDHDSLLGRDRPLSSFSSRIVGARRMGLISSEFAASLDLVRRIRNDCAHWSETIDLNKPPHSDRISNLSQPVPSATFWKELVARFGAPTRANEFRAAAASMAATLRMDVENIATASAQGILGTSMPVRPVSAKKGRAPR